MSDLDKEELEATRNMGKTADEMFEELGYIKFENEERIEYSTPLQKIDIVKDIKAIDNNIILFMQELQAINKKVEELGWLDE